MQNKKFICLTCKIILVFLLLHFDSKAQIEICGNGLDDDADGFVDQFDPDCPASNDSYFGKPIPKCNADISSGTDFTISLKFSSPSDKKIAVYSTPLVADLDGDGQSEIIAPSADSLISEDDPIRDKADSGYSYI